MPKILMVDLNNFARYPTLAIAYLATPLRQSGFEVEVLSPLNYGVKAAYREGAESWKEHLKRRIYYANNPVMQYLNEPLRKLYAQYKVGDHQPIVEAVQQQLDKSPADIVLISAYLNHYPAVKAIASLTQKKNIPLLLGGPAFSTQTVINEWLDLQGVSAIFAGEADLVIADLVCNALENKLENQAGVFTKVNRNAEVLPPLKDLDRLPIPDFSDFDWHAHPDRIIPIMMGRGCSWNVCTFCSDVTTANGRTFRSRSLDRVLDEIKVQAKRYKTNDFIFLDMKLNSDLELWYGLIDNFQKVVPQGRWIATVHVDAKGENGLDFATLQQAKQAGLTRISFGFETGSQKLSRRMGKGTNVERNHQFVQDAYRAGLSVRCSMMLGYPSETADDLQATYDFLKVNQAAFDRIRPARFKAIPGTRFEKLYHHRPSRFTGISEIKWDYRYARAAYTYQPAIDKAYARLTRDILWLIHQINREPLRDDAVQFDGLM